VTQTHAITRRRALLGAAAGALAVAGGGVELIAQGALPGRHLLDEIDGACDVSTPPEASVAAGPHTSGSFSSRARGREVGYTIAYPPGHAVGDALPFALVLHAFGGDHTSGYGGLTLAEALATNVRSARRQRPPIALVAADGGPLYWNPHPGDDPPAMLVDELIPLCRARGLTGARVGATGISMGGYGALLLAERHPGLIAAVAAISPAVWTTYSEARATNPGAYASAADFAMADVVTHTAALNGIPTRIASGSGDPFFPGVQALAARLHGDATVVVTGGCHDGAFFASQGPASLDFVAAHL
jgi:S-formylglutathione hydrolase FrmB